MFKNKIIYFILLILLSVFILYHVSVNYFFFQDDWFHINISQARNFQEFINLFKIRTDIIAWRPISKQLFFFLDYKLFGLNPIPAHLVIFSFFISNVFLLYIILKKLFNSIKISVLASFMYATSTIHFISLSWISAGEYTIGTFFWLSASLTYLLFIKSRKIYLYICSILLFIICLASTEFAITWPFVIIGLELLFPQKHKKISNLKKMIAKIYLMIPAIMIIVLYLALRFIIYPLPAKGDYGLSFSLKTIDTYVWYILWSLNIPEIFKYQLILSKFTFSKEPAFLFHFKNYSMRFLILFVIEFLIFIYVFLTNIKRKTFNLLLISVLFFSITISPVLFLPNHTFPHYLSIASIGIYAFIAYLLSQLKLNKMHNKIIISVLIVTWFLSSFTTLSFTKETHWIPGEQSISKEIITNIIKTNAVVPKKSIFYLQPSTVQIKQSLMDQNALQVIYMDKTIKTIFLDEKQDFQLGGKKDYYVNLKE